MPQEPAPRVALVIEIPRGSFLKRGSNGRIDFVSPFPCLYNYGSVHQYIGGEGDFLDALVLGPRLSAGSKVVVSAYGAVGLSERHMYDDKLVCAFSPLTEAQRRRVVWFFHIYSRFKSLLNLLRGQSGSARCEGWGGCGGHRPGFANSGGRAWSKDGFLARHATAFCNFRAHSRVVAATYPKNRGTTVVPP